MNRLDRRVPGPTELRLLGFGVAVLGAVAGGLAGLGGRQNVAIEVGLRIVGVGLFGMGAPTLHSPGALAGPAGRGVELARGGTLVLVGTVLAVFPWGVVSVAGW